jgi:pyrroloquinoline quinone biosynthesis protein D
MTIGDDSRPRLAAGVRMQTDKVTGQPVLLYAEVVVQLNPTGAAILELCDGQRSVQGLLTELGGKFNVDGKVLRTDVIEYLERLRQRRLVEVNSAEC